MSGDTENPQGAGRLPYLRKTALGLVALLLAVGLAAADKDKPDTKGTETKAKVVKVDADKGTLTVSVNGKTQTFMVTKDVKIVGPRGGVSDDRLKDDRLVPGAEVTLLTSDPGGKVLQQITLPFRTKDRDNKDK
jgi:hypothetical protein